MLFLFGCLVLVLCNFDFAIDRIEVSMRTWRKHTIDFVLLDAALFSLQHKVAFKVIDIQVQFDRLELVVIRIVITHTWLISEALL